MLVIIGQGIDCG